MAQIRLLHEERARIARDLHDELGASLAQISMLGDRIEHSREAAGGIIQRIQKNSRESLRRLDEIVWAVNPERDSLEHLATYLSKFAQDFLADSGIRFRSEIPDELPPCHLSSRLRHNLYLATREAFRNAVRHGHPTSVFLRISAAPDELRISIEDDGSGFEAAKTDASGHGLANMRTRMEAIGGRFSISSRPGGGCVISLTLPLRAKIQP
jgi:signal transduction histidine kinase